MFNSIILGLTAAVAVSLPYHIAGLWEGRVRWLSLSAPVWLLAVTCVVMIVQRFVLDRKAAQRDYDGLADLFVHIHSVSFPDSALRWLVRGGNSLLLTLFGGSVGPEGAATEFAHAMALRLRDRATRRFEQRRRTDAASSLAAGISAAFGAPFAAVLIPVELGIGGPIVPVVTAALVAFLGIRIAVPGGSNLASAGFGNLGSVLNSFRLSWIHWGAVLSIACIAGLLGAIFTRFVRYTQDSLGDLFKSQLWMRCLTSGVLVFFLFLIFRAGHAPAPQLLEKVLWGLMGSNELALLLVTQFVALALIISGFGTIGVFWPIFVLGSTMGVLFDFGIGGIPGFLGTAGLAGAAGLMGAVFGTPLAAGILAFELTHSVQGLIVALLAGFVGRFVVRFVKTPAFIDHDLEKRGVTLIEGRSAAILETISIRDAMVSDFDTVHENELVSELYPRIVKARYPFLPIVNIQGQFKGLLTVDMIQESWQTHEKMVSRDSATSPLARLIEAKDLLYRSGFKVPTVKVTDQLSMTAGLFEDTPCVPVLAEDGRVVGLLFSYNIRLAYDREVARRSMANYSRFLGSVSRSAGGR